MHHFSFPNSEVLCRACLAPVIERGVSIPDAAAAELMAAFPHKANRVSLENDPIIGPVVIVHCANGDAYWSDESGAFFFEEPQNDS